MTCPNVTVNVSTTRDANNNITGYHLSVTTSEGLNGNFSMDDGQYSHIAGQAATFEFTGALSWGYTQDDNSSTATYQMEYQIVINPDGTIVMYQRRLSN